MPTLRRKNINLRFFMIKRPTLLPSTTTSNTTKTTNRARAGNEDEGFIQSIPQTTTSSTATSSDGQPATHKDPDLTSATATPTATTINEYEDNNDDMDMDTISILGSTTPDFTIIYASDRFFFSCPGRSNSIIDSSSPTPSSSSSATADPTTGSSSHTASSSSYSTPKEEITTFTTAAVEAVQTFSPDPYLDFRRSMEEVVEAYGLDDVDVSENWNSLHELLLCYLQLNPKETHKFIVEAFADLLVALVVEREADQGGASN